MKIKVTHIQSQQSALITFDPALPKHKLQYSGDELIVKAIDAQLKQYDHAFYLRKDVLNAASVYGDLLIRQGAIYSVDVETERYLRDFFIPSFERFGYLCEYVD